jgi:hypothetical protein
MKPLYASWAEIRRCLFLDWAAPNRSFRTLRDRLPLFQIPGTSYLATFILSLRDNSTIPAITNSPLGKITHARPPIHSLDDAFYLPAVTPIYLLAP